MKHLLDQLLEESLPLRECNVLVDDAWIIPFTEERGILFKQIVEQVFYAERAVLAPTLSRTSCWHDNEWFYLYYYKHTNGQAYIIFQLDT